jgi:hypothetical protein
MNEKPTEQNNKNWLDGYKIITGILLLILLLWVVVLIRDDTVPADKTEVAIEPHSTLTVIEPSPAPPEALVATPKLLTKSADEIVVEEYLKVIGSAPDVEEKQYWVEQLRINGWSRVTLNTVIKDDWPRIITEREHVRVFGRKPIYSAERAYWMARLIKNSFSPESLRASMQYAQRYPILTAEFLTVFGRSPYTDELANWYNYYNLYFPNAEDLRNKMQNSRSKGLFVP